MNIRLSIDEAWAAIEEALIGVLTTLCADGRPITLPVWFAVDQRTICVSTPAGSKKVARVRKDPRASFLIESGERWRDLTGIHLSGTLEEVRDPVAMERIQAAWDRKYARLETPHEQMPQPVRSAYSELTILRLVPDGRILSWDNSRIPLTEG